MKKLLFSLLVAFSYSGYTQSFNTETRKDSVINLIGKFSEDRLQQFPFDAWYTKNFMDYTPNPQAIEFLKQELSEYTITLFMGTWCGDSKREVPRLYHILKASEFPLDRLTAIAVSRETDRYKQSSGGEEEGKNIHRVPTIILYKDGVEVNRIIERPVRSLEEDLVQILQGEYQSNFAGVEFLEEQFQKLGSERVEKLRKRLQRKVKNLVPRFSELNTYSHVLSAAGKKNQALIVAQINLALFPEEPMAYMNVGQQFQQLEKVSEAKVYFDKALAIDPNNEALQKRIRALLQIQQN